MPGKPKYSSNLHGSRQSTGGRPLIVYTVSLLLLTFYLREGDTGMIPLPAWRGDDDHVSRSHAGRCGCGPFNAIGNAIGNAGAPSETLSDSKGEQRLTAKVAELSEAQETAARLETRRPPVHITA